MSCSGPLSTPLLLLVVLAQLSQHHWIQALRAPHPFFQVLHTGPSLQVGGEVTACVAEPVEAATELRFKVVVDGEPLVVGRRAEVELMEVEEPMELLDRLGMVVDTQVDEGVSPAVSAAAPDHPQRRRLLATTVAPGGLGGGEGSE